MRWPVFSDRSSGCMSLRICRSTSLSAYLLNCVSASPLSELLSSYLNACSKATVWRRMYNYQNVCLTTVYPVCPVGEIRLTVIKSAFRKRRAIFILNKGYRFDTRMFVMPSFNSVHLAYSNWQLSGTPLAELKFHFRTIFEKSKHTHAHAPTDQRTYTGTYKRSHIHTQSLTHAHIDVECATRKRNCTWLRLVGPRDRPQKQ